MASDSLVACGCSFMVFSPSEYCVKFLGVLEGPVPAVVSAADWSTELPVLFSNSLVVVLIFIPRSVVASRVSSLVV